MRCPYCDYEDTKVIDSRFNEGKQRRRRICTECGKRFTTYECIERPETLVLKKNNTYEPFDKSKLIRGLSLRLPSRPRMVTLLVSTPKPAPLSRSELSTM